MTELDTSWITTYENDYNKYKFIYIEEVEKIDIFYIYLDEDKNIIEIKKDKTNIENQKITKERLIYLIKNNNKINDIKYKINYILKYNITIKPENIIKFINTPNTTDENYSQIIHSIDDIIYENTINIFQDLNALFIIYSIHPTQNQTKKVYYYTKNRKTKRK